MGLHVLTHTILKGLHGSGDNIVDGVLFGRVDIIFTYGEV